MTVEFHGLSKGAYRVILADPAWKFSCGGRRNPATHYPCMKLADIKALPVKELAHPDGCRLFMWVTLPFLEKGLDVLRSWGFRYSTARGWAKLWPREDEMFLYPDSFAKGTGYEVNGNLEMLLIGKRGKPERLGAKKPSSLIFARRREHSRKPDVLRDEIAGLFWGPRCELFARSTHPGFEAWGNEAGKFDLPPQQPVNGQEAAE